MILGRWSEKWNTSCKIVVHWHGTCPMPCPHTFLHYPRTLTSHAPPPLHTTRYGTSSILCNDSATCPAASPPPASPLPPPAPPANSSAPNATCHVCQSYCLGCSSSPSATTTDSTSGLSAGAIAGIVVAALLALVALALLLWFLFRPSEPGTSLCSVRTVLTGGHPTGYQLLFIVCSQMTSRKRYGESNGLFCVDLCGPVWAGGVDQCGLLRTSADWCGPVRTGVDQCGLVWTSADWCGPVWGGVNRCGQVWTINCAAMLSNDFTQEVKAMARLQHPTLVPLLGYCIDYNEISRQMEQIIVSQFMPNGDLSHRTSPGAKPISKSWPPHLPIPPPHLPGAKPMPLRAKVADFGFGVLVIELLTGREPILSVDGSQSHICEWATAELSSSDVSSIIDPRMASPAVSTGDVTMVHSDVMQSLASLALACTAMPAASRPSMVKVLSQLKHLYEEVVRRERDNGLGQGSGFVGVDMGVGGVGGMVKEKWESPADGASAVSVTPVTAVRDTIGSLEGNESSSAGEGTSGEASGSAAGYRN
ncbi:unnamed protein product [Closterium sp. Naga37s-1]|nr:unnamed protein product [Closterium sp. Naga37s-1]